MLKGKKKEKSLEDYYLKPHSPLLKANLMLTPISGVRMCEALQSNFHLHSSNAVNKRNKLCIANQLSFRLV